uniref:Uncharacterized protein n=1 Tax=mine drainage metagenome TaxID=410659 RepID=E6QP87_9ZZZZ
MAMTRGRPGSPEVRKGKNVGPNAPEETLRAPWGSDTDVGDGDDKTLRSPNGSTVEGAGLPLNNDYNSIWEGK